MPTNMKKIYESIKGILSEAPATYGVMGLDKYQKFKPGEGPVDNTQTTDLRLGRKSPKDVVYDPETKKNISIAKRELKLASQVDKDRLSLPPAAKAAISQNKPAAAPQPAAKKPMTPFEKEFAAARARGDKEFTWHTKEGKPYQVATKLKGEVSAPKPQAAAAPPKDEPVKQTSRRDADMARLQDLAKQDSDTSKPADTFDKEKSDKMWADVRAEIEADKKANQPGEPIKVEPKQDLEMDVKTIDVTKDKEKNSKKTNEDNQMSINKKFDVSDSLYNAVMEVMSKSSGGTVPKNEKQKQLAAKHGDPNLITHGDVLKARGVKMKEEIEQIDEVGNTEAGQKALKAVHKRAVERLVDMGRKVKSPEDIDDMKVSKAFKTVKGSYKRSYGKDPFYAVKEDIEQVDEISKQTLGSYISKSADKAREHGFYGGVAFTKGNLKQSDYHAKKELKRTQGLNKAVNRLTKEDIEQVDELSRGKLVGYIEKASKTKGAEAVARIAGIKKAAQKLKDIKKQSTMQAEEVLDEGKRLISKHGEDMPFSAKVYKDTDWNEYQVHYFKNGKHMGEGPVSYHGDDKEDAQATADQEVKRMNSVKEDTMRGGKFTSDAPRPGEVPSPDEGYRGAGKPLYTPADKKKKPQQNTTKAIADVEESVEQVNESAEENYTIHSNNFLKHIENVKDPATKKRLTKAFNRLDTKFSKSYYSGNNLWNHSLDMMDLADQAKEASSVKEDVEHINEVSKSVLRNYLKKAVTSHGDESFVSRVSKDPEEKAISGRIAANRATGIVRAHKKMTKEDLDPKYKTPETDRVTKAYANNPNYRKEYPGAGVAAYRDDEAGQKKYKERTSGGVWNKVKDTLGVDKPDERYGPRKESMDTPGNSYEHQCAIHVKSEEWGEGRTITTQHADPDAAGNIAWYDVMFEHGIEKGVPTESLEILVSESHMHSKRKKK